MKRSEKREMKNIKIDAEVHGKLIFLSEIFGVPISDVIDEMAVKLYPDIEARIKQYQEKKRAIAKNLTAGKEEN